MSKRGSARPPADDLPIRSKSVPGSCERKLASAECRLIGAIAHAEPRARLVADAERVRRAQLGAIAYARVADFPTELEDAQNTRHVTKLEAAARMWEAISVDEIIARYAAGSTPAS